MDHRHMTVAGEVFTRLLMFFLGMIMLVPAAYTLHTYCFLRFFGHHANGTVIHSSSGRDWGGRPLVQYRDEQGEIHEFKSRAKTHWFKRPVRGENIELFFDKDAPDTVVINNYYYYVFLPLLFALAGCYCCFKSIWFHSPRWRRTEAS